MNDMGAFADYLRVERGLAETSIKVYVYEVGRFPYRRLTTEKLRKHNIKAGGEASTVTRRLSAFKAYCRFHRMPDITTDLARPKRHRGMPRPVLNPEELLEQASPTMRAICVALGETGLRISEAFSVRLQLPIVDHDLRIKGKGGKERFVPLSDSAVLAWTALGGRMPWSKGTVQRKMKRELGVTPHQWRHLFATRLASANADILDIAKLLGHASTATTQVYADYSVDRLREVNERRLHLGRPAMVKEAVS